MTIFEQEKQYPNLMRYSPCQVCSNKIDCKDECLRFKEYTQENNTRNRREKFRRFALKMGVE